MNQQLSANMYFLYNNSCPTQLKSSLLTLGGSGRVSRRFFLRFFSQAPFPCFRPLAFLFSSFLSLFFFSPLFFSCLLHFTSIPIESLSTLPSPLPPTLFSHSFSLIDLSIRISYSLILSLLILFVNGLFFYSSSPSPSLSDSLSLSSPLHSQKAHLLSSHILATISQKSLLLSTLSLGRSHLH